MSQIQNGIYVSVLDEHNSENKPMAGVIVEAGVAMVNPKAEKADQVSNTDNNEISVWDESDRLVPEAQLYSDSSSVLKINHPLMIMVKEQRVVCI